MLRSNRNKAKRKMTTLDGFTYGIYMLATSVMLCACTTALAVKELPHPDTGKVVEATVKTDKFCGIPYDTDIEYPTVPKSGKQLSGEARQKVANFGTYALILGIALFVAGMVLSLAFSAQMTRIPQLVSTGLLAGGSISVFSGLTAIGLAAAWRIVMVVIVLGVIGFILYVCRNKGLKKWPLRKSGSKGLN